METQENEEKRVKEYLKELLYVGIWFTEFSYFGH